VNSLYYIVELSAQVEYGFVRVCLLEADEERALVAAKRFGAEPMMLLVCRNRGNSTPPNIDMNLEFL
jgi:hypothetical protein